MKRRLRGPGATAVATAFTAAVATYVAAVAWGRTPFYYDAAIYWDLSRSFTHGGHFSLFGFESSLRGYAFPLLIRGVREIGGPAGLDDLALARLLNAVVFAALAAVAAPKLAELSWPQRPWGIGRRLALTAILLIFWIGFASFPLTDFPALLMAVTALVAVSRTGRPGPMTLAGLATGLAIVLRPSYVLLGPVVVLLFAVDLWTGRRTLGASTRRLALCAALLLAGFAVVALPQSLVTHHHFGSWSFVPGSQQNLSAFQLTTGMRLQRYDTYIGGGKPPQMNYVDRSGTRLLDRQHDAKIRGSAHYVGLTVSHPITMGGVFLRHAVNGLDARYTTPYVTRIAPAGQRVRRLAGFLLVFLALVRLLWPEARRSLGPARWRYPAALLATCLTSIAAAMETRFLLPIYLLAYLLVLAPGWPNPMGDAPGWRRYATPAAIAIGYVLFMAVAWHVASAATDDLRFG